MRASAIVRALAAVTALVATSAAPSCNVDIKFRTPKRVLAGRKFTASASIKSMGTATLDNFYFQLELPDYMLPKSGRASAFAIKKDGPQPLLDGRYVHFRAMSLKARKTLRVKVKVGVPTCQAAGPVQLQGIAYNLDSSGDLICSTTAMPANTTVARKTKLLNAKHAIQGNCTTPTPGTNFGLLGANTRCTESVPLGTLDLANGRRALADTAVEEAHGRQLLPSASSASLQCWSCCGKALNATGPYNFNLGADGQCYCCGTCTPVHVPDWMAYTSYNRPEWTNKILEASPGAYFIALGGADSKVLFALDNAWIWRSTNYGANWTQVAGTNLGVRWNNIACDDTGTTCLASTYPNNGPGAIYRSTNGGATWSIVANTSGVWTTLWCATTCFAAIELTSVSPGEIYKSTDSGATFTAMPNTKIQTEWGVVACDATATKCLATGAGSPNARPIYISSDGFQTLAIVPNSYGVANGATVSRDGTKMIFAQYQSRQSASGSFVDGPGFIWYSHDGGQTFEKSNAPQSFYDRVSCDAAFKRCAVVHQFDENYGPVPMLTSCDGGRTWSEDLGDKKYWRAVHVSPDGRFMYAVGDYSIYSYPLPVV